MQVSVIVPAYKSEKYIEKTIKTIADTLDKEHVQFEILIVDDKSPDGVWGKIIKCSQIDKRVRGMRLSKNYGQHAAIFMGLKNCVGRYIVTLDDDLQNPPSEITKLLKKLDSGHDLAVGVFDAKKHGFLRGVFSTLIHKIVSFIFNSEKGFRHTNFRAMSEEVKDRIIGYQGIFPYINGLAILNSFNPVNVPVKHNARLDGSSSYSLWKLIKLTGRIVFSYSDLPIKILAFCGIFTSIASLVTGYYAIYTALEKTGTMPGWASIIVLMSFSNAIIFVILTAMASFLSNINSIVSFSKNYHVAAKTGD